MRERERVGNREIIEALPCSLELFISYGTIFFSHNKTVSVSLSAAKTINRTDTKHSVTTTVFTLLF
jgi:hypothetical protein